MKYTNLLIATVLAGCAPQPKATSNTYDLLSDSFFMPTHEAFESNTADGYTQGLIKKIPTSVFNIPLTLLLDACREVLGKSSNINGYAFATAQTKQDCAYYLSADSTTSAITGAAASVAAAGVSKSGASLPLPSLGLTINLPGIIETAKPHNMDYENLPARALKGQLYQDLSQRGVEPPKP